MLNNIKIIEQKALKKLQPRHKSEKCSLDLKLQHAVLQGNPNKVREIIKVDQINITETSTTHGPCLLHYASAAGHVDVVQYLLNYYEGIDVSCKDENSLTPLLYACVLGHMEITELLVDFLLKTPELNVLLEKNSFILSNNSIISPLHIIAAKGQLKIMKSLALKFIEELRNEHLYLSLSHRHIMKDLLRNLHFTSSDLIPAIYIALKQNHLTTIQFIVAMTTSNYKNIELSNNSLLDIACINGTLSMAKYFIESLTYNPNITKETTTTPLHCAAKNSHIHLVKYLIHTHHCDPHVKNKFNDTPLHAAVLGGGLEIMKYFTEDLNIDVNTTGHFGRTALHHAAEKRHLDTVRYLIHTHHCDPLVKDQFKDTPLHRAGIGGGLEVVKYFTEDMSIDVNLTGQFGRTALHHAAEGGYLDTVKYLMLTHHCDPLVKDQFNNTPLHAAASGGGLDVSKYFH